MVRLRHWEIRKNRTMRRSHAWQSNLPEQDDEVFFAKYDGALRHAMLKAAGLKDDISKEMADGMETWGGIADT